MPHFADVNLFILMCSRLQHPEGKTKKNPKAFQQHIPFSVVTHHSSLVYQGQKAKGVKYKNHQVTSDIYSLGTAETATKNESRMENFTTEQSLWGLSKV